MQTESIIILCALVGVFYSIPGMFVYMNFLDASEEADMSVKRVSKNFLVAFLCGPLAWLFFVGYMIFNVLTGATNWLSD